MTTLRDGDINKPPPTTRQSRSRSGSSGGWSSDNGNHKRSKKTRRDWSRSTSPLIPLDEARKIRRAAEDAVTKEFTERDLAEKIKLQRREQELDAEAAEIERRMEREANGIASTNLYSSPETSHTPPPPEPSQKEKESPVEDAPNVSEPVTEIYTNEELLVTS